MDIRLKEISSLYEESFATNEPYISREFSTLLQFSSTLQLSLPMEPNNKSQNLLNTKLYRKFDVLTKLEI